MHTFTMHLDFANVLMNIMNSRSRFTAQDTMWQRQSTSWTILSRTKAIYHMHNRKCGHKHQINQAHTQIQKCKRVAENSCENLQVCCCESYDQHTCSHISARNQGLTQPWIITCCLVSLSLEWMREKDVQDQQRAACLRGSRVTADQGRWNNTPKWKLIVGKVDASF